MTDVTAGSITLEQVSALASALNLRGVDPADALLGRASRIAQLKSWIDRPEVFATDQARFMAEEIAKFFVE